MSMLSDARCWRIAKREANGMDQVTFSLVDEDGEHHIHYIVSRVSEPDDIIMDITEVMTESDIGKRFDARAIKTAIKKFMDAGVDMMSKNDFLLERLPLQDHLDSLKGEKHGD